MVSRSFILLPLALAIPACDKGEPMRVTINSDGNSSSKPGRVEAGSGGFKADLNIPGLAALGKKMEIDGVPLYPGSSVQGVNINDRDGRETVSIKFSAPGDRAKVGDWFAKQFSDHEFQANATPTGYAGKTSDGDWFALDLAGAGEATRGEFRMGKAN